MRLSAEDALSQLEMRSSMQEDRCDAEIASWKLLGFAYSMLRIEDEAPCCVAINTICILIYRQQQGASGKATYRSADRRVRGRLFPA